ncbi:MAG: tRNA (N6-threonylcarbamoyladenosine(37)-N6)-methyltransferase TrmO [Clostridia bacterium]|nr:tRNA (N6-threonylcarbamoyladenosine(37)-N6)-methyltransferase TrmO [Clostridia bacterium]
MTIEPIAYIYTDFKEKFGIPRQSGQAPSLRGRIVLEPAYRQPDALRGIEGFSHLWLIFDFSKAHRDEWSPTVRPPRLGGNRRVGVFASRSPFRPNSLGLSCVELIGVEPDNGQGMTLLVGGADLLDGTPIYDIKPYLPYADCKEHATGGYTDEVPRHRLHVEFPRNLAAALSDEAYAAASECLAEDPRPSYQDDPERLYSMRFAAWDIRFRVADDLLTVVAVDQEADV